MTGTSIRLAQDHELPMISALACRVWRAHYPSILSRAQIEYMLHWMYDVKQLREDVRRGVTYELLLLRESGNERLIGFCGYEETGSELKLHKLYLEVAEHGRGLGSLLLKHVEDEARRRKLEAVVLAVNRRNEKALRAYRRNGYTTRLELKKDIGNGFVMDDYLLAKSL
jgi:GNAT superfamily N-acetyltransferase